MEENRFLKVYQDYKKEKENDRFRCLIEDRHRPIVYNNDNNRFHCLIENNTQRVIPRLVENPQKVVIPQAFPELDIGTSNQLKKDRCVREMIVREKIVKDTRETFTKISLVDGKLVSKEVYEDGSEVSIESSVHIIKPVYSSWAAVLHPSD